MEGNTKRILHRLASQRERQTGDFMDWFTDGQTDWIHDTWTGPQMEQPSKLRPF